MTTRTDIHRVSNFKPESYDYLFSFSYASAEMPGYNIALLAAVRTGETQREPIISYVRGYPQAEGHREVESPWGKLPFFVGGGGSCSCCGAHFVHGSCYLHRESGEAIVLGHICCEKAGIFTNDEWQDAYRESVRRARATRRDRSARFGSIRSWARENSSLVALLKTDHDIARSMRARLIETACKWGLTTKQITLLKKLADDAANPKAQETKVAAPRTDERITVEGTIVSIKEKDSDWGGYAMTVKVETADGVWLTWGSLPSAIDDAKRGDRVRFVAKIVVSDRDESFTFFKRPTKATIIEAASAVS